MTTGTGKRVWIEMDEADALIASNVLTNMAKREDAKGNSLAGEMAEQYRRMAAALYPEGRAPMTMVVMRPAVRAFAVAVERALARNDHKPGVEDAHPFEMCCKTMEELGEVSRALLAGPARMGLAEFAKRVAAEIADVGASVVLLGETVDGMARQAGWDGE
jgi:NTP pyrophosphatase (non-canonical NTP hydrolase)